jgi:hypothetical protein
MVHCKKCNSTNVVAYDNEPLACVTYNTLPAGEQHDHEVYIMFWCNACNERFTEAFDVIEKQPITLKTTA